MKKFILLKLVFIIICFVNTILYAQQIKLTQDVPDSSAGNVPCYKIETDYAVYYLEKYGLGLSSMIDKDGNDWISFHNAKYSQAGGEYRGFPNAVHQQDGNFFHPKNRATGLSVSEIFYVGSDKITIKGTSGSNNWECVWNFYSTYCTFTMTKMWNRGKYWILYEGTPAGKYDDTDWWMTSQVKEKTALTIRVDCFWR
jgi:hypothetical protein